MRRPRTSPFVLGRDDEFVLILLHLTLLKLGHFCGRTGEDWGRSEHRQEDTQHTATVEKDFG